MAFLRRWSYRVLAAAAALGVLVVLVAWPWSYRRETSITYVRSTNFYALDSKLGGVYAVHEDYQAWEPPNQGWRVFYGTPDWRWDSDPNRFFPVRHFYYIDHPGTTYSIVIVPHWTLALLLAILPAHAAWRFRRGRKTGGAGFTPIAGSD